MECNMDAKSVLYNKDQKCPDLSVNHICQLLRSLESATIRCWWWNIITPTTWTLIHLLSIFCHSRGNNSRQSLQWVSFLPEHLCRHLWMLRTQPLILFLWRWSWEGLLTSALRISKCNQGPILQWLEIVCGEHWQISVYIKEFQGHFPFSGNLHIYIWGNLVNPKTALRSHFAQFPGSWRLYESQHKRQRFQEKTFNTSSDLAILIF